MKGPQSGAGPCRRLRKPGRMTGYENSPGLSGRSQPAGGGSLYSQNPRLSTDLTVAELLQQAPVEPAEIAGAHQHHQFTGAGPLGQGGKELVDPGPGPGRGTRL